MVGDVPDKDTRMWAMLCHLSALCGFIGIPFGNVWGPLIIWLIKREESPYIDAHGKEALNFQISVSIYGVVAGILIIVLIGLPILLALMVADVVFIIKAAVKANDGQSYRYPLTIRFLK